MNSSTTPLMNTITVRPTTTGAISRSAGAGGPLTR